MTGATEHTTESGRLAAFFLRLEQHDLLGPAERAALQAGFGPDITIAAGGISFRKVTVPRTAP